MANETGKPALITPAGEWYYRTHRVPNGAACARCLSPVEVETMPDGGQRFRYTCACWFVSSADEVVRAPVAMQRTMEKCAKCELWDCVVAEEYLCPDCERCIVAAVVAAAEQVVDCVDIAGGDEESFTDAVTVLETAVGRLRHARELRTGRR